MINGIINVYKEQGFTSFDVVAKLRGIVHQKKIGHTGTLDPDAVGVLPVCLGNATKVCELMADRDKTYEAVMILGMETDTQDTSGVLIAESDKVPAKQEIINAIMSFVGEYNQIPPMYSAKKVGGKKLYELARAGKEVERKPSRVNIKEIEIKEIGNARYNDVVDIIPKKSISENKCKEPDNEIHESYVNYARFSVTCSKGTYIRTLCYDIGKVLGCGACMGSLKRTRVGGFTADNALTLLEIQKLADEGRLLDAVRSVDACFEMYERLELVSSGDRFLYNGNALVDSNFANIPQVLQDKTCYRIYDSKGNFCAIYQYDGEKTAFSPVKMFLNRQETI